MVVFLHECFRVHSAGIQYQKSYSAGLFLSFEVISSVLQLLINSSNIHPIRDTLSYLSFLHDRERHQNVNDDVKPQIVSMKLFFQSFASLIQDQPTHWQRLCKTLGILLPSITNLFLSCVAYVVLPYKYLCTELFQLFYR